jgi:hypothetical protein
LLSIQYVYELVFSIQTNLSRLAGAKVKLFFNLTNTFATFFSKSFTIPKTRNFRFGSANIETYTPYIQKKIGLFSIFFSIGLFPKTYTVKGFDFRVENPIQRPNWGSFLKTQHPKNVVKKANFLVLVFSKYDFKAFFCSSKPAIQPRATRHPAPVR